MQHLKLEELVSSVVKGLNYIFVGLERLLANDHMTLRVYIDLPQQQRISTGDCEKVSLQLGTVLDTETDLMRDKYILEVSSPGLDRKLFTFEQCLEQVGKEIKVRLSAPLAGRQNFRGVLNCAEEGNLFLTVDGTELQIPFSAVKRANVVPEW